MDYGKMCPRYEQAIELLGKRWTCLILRILLSGPCRFSVLTAQIRDLSDRMLSARLRELEADGVVERRVYPDTPVRIEYALTDKGRALAPVVEEIQGWADRWVRLDAAPAVRMRIANEPCADARSAGGVQSDTTMGAPSIDGTGEQLGFTEDRTSSQSSATS